MDHSCQYEVSGSAMKFAAIEMLFLIWTVPVAVLVMIYGFRKRTRILERFSSQKGLAAIVPDKRRDRRKLKSVLILISLLLMCIAATGPQYGYHWREIEQKGIDVLIAMDCSRSMMAGDISPTRLDRAKREVYDLLMMLEGDRVGLVAFAGTAFLQCPLTLDYNAFHLFLQTLTPDYLPVGGTDIAGAVREALSGFEAKSNSEKAVILITDGENTGSGDPIEAAKEAADAGVKIFCIGVGDEEGVPIPDKEEGYLKDREGNIVLSRLDQETLKKMAVITKGVYIRSVAGDMDLDRIYKQEIRGKMESETLAGGRRQVWENRFQWVLIPAVLAFALEMFLSPITRRSAAILFFTVAFLLGGNGSALANHVQEGIEAYEKGDYESALKHFIDAQLNHPDKPELYYNIGNAFYKKGDYESAAKNYREALSSEDKALKQKAYYNLGNANFKMQKLEDAVSGYEDALNIEPEDLKARQNLEFTKKVIEQKKQEPPQDCENDKNDQKQGEEQENKKDESRQGDESSEDKDEQSRQGWDKQEEERDRERSSPEDEDEGDGRRSQPQPPEAEEPEDQEAAQAQRSGDEEPSEGDKENGTAARLLNRLKDQPGRAMIPAYRERRIEKDW